MKATFDLPDDLYRSAKARSALEGRPMRSVVIELLQAWLRSSSPGTRGEEQPTEEELARYPWLVVSRRHLRAGMDHDLGAIREAAARAWGSEAATKQREQGG